MIKTQRRGALSTTVTVKSDTGEVAPFTTVINDNSAMSLGQPFLWGYRIWRDERYLRAAIALADFYAQAQFPEGGWSHTFVLKADGSVEPVGQTANFEEWVQSNGLRCLAAVYHLTGDERYKQAASKAGEVILRAQDPSGWWPWGAAIGSEDKRPGYLKGPTLNDWNLNACIGDCLVLYHMTGDERYLVPLRKHLAWLQSIPPEKKGWLWHAHRSWPAEENQGKPSGYTKNLTRQFGAKLPSKEALAGLECLDRFRP